MAAAGGPPPTPPRNLLSGGMGALIGFGAVALIGVLLWFLVLKPDSGTKPPGPTAPPSTSAPATTTPPTTDTPPPTSPTDGDDGITASFSMNVCASVDDQLNCVDPFPIGTEGWILPTTAQQFVIHLLGEGMKAGDVIRITAVDKATGQQVYELAWDPLPTEGLDFSLPVVYYTNPFTLEQGQTWSGSYEHILYYNDQPVTGWVYPLVITFQ